MKQLLLLGGMLILLSSYACRSRKAMSSPPPAPTGAMEEEAAPLEPFEGRLIYKTKFEDPTNASGGGGVRMLMGNKSVYSIKGARYKSQMNGMFKMMQLYAGGDTLYSQMRGMNGVFWEDARQNPDSLIEWSIEKDVTTIMGLSCHVMTIKAKEGFYQHYYHPSIPADPRLHARHRYGFWAFFIEKTRSLPLKTVLKDGELNVEMEVTDIQRMQLDPAEFAIPAGARIEGVE
ncbi:MAG: hypothetical protein AAFR61_00160 [Bacteroidota bacterium]